MDPVTHGLIGATASQSFAEPKTHRAAAFTGFVSAMLADLDVLISSTSDPLLTVELHRHFTHSLIFIPIGALVATLVTWWLVKKYLTLKETYLFSLAGYATAGVADVITSYGVHLLWPFVDGRYSLNIISVFDPLFSLGIILLAGFALYKKRKRFAFVAWGWIFFYLAFGFVQQQRTEDAAVEFALRNGHHIEQMVVKPTIANQILWSVRYEAGGNLHAAGIRLMPFSEPTVYEGGQATLLDWQERYAAYRGTILYKDIRRFSELSEGFLIQHPKDENVIGDGRYSMLPTTLSPLWGIKLDPGQPDQHVDYVTYRDTDTEIRRAFLDMLLGR